MISIIIQSTLMIPRFSICKFTDSLKFFLETPNPFSWCFHRLLQTRAEWWKISVTWCVCSQLLTGDALASCFCFHPVNKYLFCALLSATSLAFVCFLVAISQFKMVPEGSAEVLAVVPEFMIAAMCILEKLSVLDKLHSVQCFWQWVQRYRINNPQ